MSCIISGAAAFRLVDTFGMPFDELQSLLRERGAGFDWPEFCAEAIRAGWGLRRLRALVEGSGVPLGEDVRAALINTITRAAVAESAPGAKS